ncbi:transport ATP-binding protein CydC [Klebsiella variicola]|nr:transport ATP-binding protein CydC [Klebsiella variicola]
MADVDTLDHLYLRVISPLVGALVVIVVVTCGLSLLDVTLALTLGGIMLVTLLVMPPLFYRAGKPAGESMTQFARPVSPTAHCLATGPGRADGV